MFFGLTQPVDSSCLLAMPGGAGLEGTKSPRGPGPVGWTQHCPAHQGAICPLPGCAHPWSLYLAQVSALGNPHPLAWGQAISGSSPAGVPGHPYPCWTLRVHLETEAQAEWDAWAHTLLCPLLLVSVLVTG